MMRLRNCTIFSLVIITVCLFASCSQDELLEPQVQIQDESTRAVSDIFHVEEIRLPEEVSIWSDAPRGVDREGNFYFVVDNSDDPDYAGYVYKYDLLVDSLIRFAPWKDNGLYCERFCFDEKNNLCYMEYDYETERYGVRRIKADGSAITQQWFNDSISVSSMSAAVNGNLFILGSSSGGQKLYKLNNNGVLSELDIDVSGVAAHAIYKVSGAIIYLYGGDYWMSNKYFCYKLNTNTGTVEEFELRGEPTTSSSLIFASSPSHANLYTIRDRNVVRLRPNAATDLVVGAIPNTYKNADGQFVNIEMLYYSDPELFMNPDATVFYTVGDACDVLYKLTLD